jgi:hypothetical protein
MERAAKPGTFTTGTTGSGVPPVPGLSWPFYYHHFYFKSLTPRRDLRCDIVRDQNTENLSKRPLKIIGQHCSVFHTLLSPCQMVGITFHLSFNGYELFIFIA